MDKNIVFKLRCNQTDRKTITELARSMGVKQSEAVRRAVIQAAEIIRRNQGSK